jgi:Tfp pilus assembly protein PilN
VKAVNLIPREGRRGVRGSGGLAVSPTYALLGLLAVALLFVTLYALSANTISSRKAKLSSLRAEVTQEQALASRLATYTAFEKLASTRAETVREIAATRFNWYGALSDLAKVVPANTSLQSLYGSVAPGATTSATSAGVGAGAASSLRSDLSVPAIELTGCTKTQDDVARLMSRLRVINGVTRVTLGDSQKPDSSVATASGATSGGCGRNAPTFDLVIFFQALAGAGPTGDTPASSTPAAGTTGTTTTPAAGTSTTATTPVAATTATSTGGSK